MTTKAKAPKLPNLKDVNDATIRISQDGLILKYGRSVKVGKTTARVEMLTVIRKSIHFTQTGFPDDVTKPACYWVYSGLGEVSAQLAMTASYVKHAYSTHTSQADHRHERIRVTLEGVKLIADRLRRAEDGGLIFEGGHDIIPSTGYSNLEDYLSSNSLPIEYDVTID